MTAQPPESVFVDTCVLLNYVYRYWEGDKVSDLLQAEDIEHVISDDVADEFDEVCDRRHDIYPDMVQFLVETDEEISEYDPDDRKPWVAGNDHQHIRTIQFKLASTTSGPREMLRILRRFLRNLDAVISRVSEELIDTVVSPGGSIPLSFSLGDVIDNTADQRVVCDAAQWSADGGSGVFVTLDKSDLVNNAAEINAVLESEKSSDWCLNILLPGEITLTPGNTARPD